MDERLRRELHRTNPDIVVHVPRGLDGVIEDGINEHFIVFDAPDGALLGVWTQSSASLGRGVHQRNRIVMARSDEDRKSVV